MVLPVGGMGSSMGGAPPQQVLLTMPYLKAALVAVTIVVIGEFVATYFNEAISDCLTPLFGILVLRDVTQAGQCVLCLGVISGFNCLSDLTSLILILVGQRYVPGARYFFSTVCYGDVRVYDPSTRTTKTENRELCSWRTVVGNACIVLGVLTQLICCRLSLKIFQAYQREGMNAMLDEYEGEPGDGLRASAPGVADLPHPGAVASEGPASMGSRASNRPRGFVPFSGEGQRLG
mmetsp:Transcript_72496/g.169927  ORF Transcript_72496/g.169927 Transcript_72496/m.169927 type:complete len:234 (+) Transcript_72496:47-748(+)|eukprot:s499_g22.t1